MTPHPSLTRRRMIGYSLATLGLGFALPTATAGEPGGLRRLMSSRTHGQRCTVVIDLAGGNDGFNTVVPYRSAAYYAARPQLAVPAGHVLTVSEQVGLHPALRPLLAAWDAGDVGILQGIGIQDLACHEAARVGVRDEWSDAGLAQERGDAALFGVSFAGGAGPLSGCGLPWTNLSTASSCAEYVVAAQDTGETSPAALRARIATTAVGSSFPDSRLGQELAQAAGLLASGVTPVAVVVSHEGYDTHHDQRQVHDPLLVELATAVAAFRQALIACGRWQDVLVVTTSEFGRDLHENVHGGTEHGQVSAHLALGGCLRGGVYGHTDPAIATPTAHDIYGRLLHDFRTSEVAARRVDPTHAFAASVLV